MAQPANEALKDGEEIHLEECLPVKNDGPGAPLAMTIDPATEKRLRRKFDWRILTFGTIIWLMANIDRTNTGNAIILGMREDADLQGNRFNIILTGFYLSYILLEL